MDTKGMHSRRVQQQRFFADADSVERRSLSLSSPTVYVVDDDHRMRSILRHCLEEDQRVVEDYGSFEAFMKPWLSCGAGCILIKADMPEIGGRGLLRLLQTNSYLLPSVVITGCSNVRMAICFMRAGVADILEPQFTEGELLKCVGRALQTSNSMLDREIEREIAANRLSALTARQRQIMTRVLSGEPSKNIAVDLAISRRTVETHRAAIMKKTGCNSLPALARFALVASPLAVDQLAT